MTNLDTRSDMFNPFKWEITIKISTRNTPETKFGKPDKMHKHKNK